MLTEEFPISNRTKNSLILSGYITEQDFEGKFIEDLKKIKGFGEKGILEIREYLYAKFGIVLKHKPKDKKIKNSSHAKAVISKLLGHSKNIYWPKEMVTASRLVDIYGLDALLKVKPVTTVGTLSYYFTFEGKNHIRKYLPAIVVEEKSVEELRGPEEEVQLTVELQVSPPKSIRDFLKI